jgi:hypothetical protein
MPEPVRGRFVTLSRARDGAQLFLVWVGADAWLVSNVIASGVVVDPHLAGLAGRRVDGHSLLRWAAGVLPSVTLVAPDDVDRAQLG